jgi:hypothetical protein
VFSSRFVSSLWDVLSPHTDPRLGSRWQVQHLRQPRSLNRWRSPLDRPLPPGPSSPSRFSLRLRPQPEHGGRPAFVPRTTERRQEVTGTAGASNPQVRRRIWVSPLVAKSAPRTLSRWRHGFEPRWDYQRSQVPGRSLSARGRVLAVREERPPLGHGRAAVRDHACLPRPSGRVEVPSPSVPAVRQDQHLVAGHQVRERPNLYAYGSGWQAVRKKVLVRDGYRCQLRLRRHLRRQSLPGRSHRPAGGRRRQ